MSDNNENEQDKEHIPVCMECKSFCLVTEGTFVNLIVKPIMTITPIYTSTNQCKNDAYLPRRDTCTISAISAQMFPK